MKSVVILFTCASCFCTIIMVASELNVETNVRRFFFFFLFGFPHPCFFPLIPLIIGAILRFPCVRGAVSPSCSCSTSHEMYIYEIMICRTSGKKLLDYGLGNVRESRSVR